MEIRQLALEDGHWVVENIEQKTRLDCIGMRLALSGMLISDNGRLALSCACDSSRLQRVVICCGMIPRSRWNVFSMLIGRRGLSGWNRLNFLFGTFHLS